jgi:hypothetical protein
MPFVNTAATYEAWHGDHEYFLKSSRTFGTQTQREIDNILDEGKKTVVAGQQIDFLRKVRGGAAKQPTSAGGGAAKKPATGRRRTRKRRRHTIEKV